MWISWVRMHSACALEDQAAWWHSAGCFPDVTELQVRVPLRSHLDFLIGNAPSTRMWTLRDRQSKTTWWINGYAQHGQAEAAWSHTPQSLPWCTIIGHSQLLLTLSSIF
jgi:hypothetical protein